MRESLREIGRGLRGRLRFYRVIYKDPRTPRRARFFFWLAFGYLALPLDLIPDFIPVLGHLDDVVVVPLLLRLALRAVPDEVYAAHAGLLREESAP
ncbi:DUF1232 domain-containing protein [bacterium]|nr:DUF1232 domain-containing protein [bacterium]